MYLDDQALLVRPDAVAMAEPRPTLATSDPPESATAEGDRGDLVPTNPVVRPMDKVGDGVPPQS